MGRVPLIEDIWTSMKIQEHLAEETLPFHVGSINNKGRWHG